MTRDLARFGVPKVGELASLAVTELDSTTRTAATQRALLARLSNVLDNVSLKPIILASKESLNKLEASTQKDSLWSAVGLWRQLWLLRGRFPEDLSEDQLLIQIQKPLRSELARESTRSFEEAAQFLSRHAPSKPAWEIGVLAEIHLKRSGKSALALLWHLFECHVALVPHDKFNSLVEEAVSILKGQQGQELWSNAIAAVVDAVNDRTSAGNVVIRKKLSGRIKQTLLKGVLDTASGSNIRWWRALGAAASLVNGDEQQMLELRKRANVELENRSPESGRWADLWWDLVQKLDESLIEEAALTDYVAQGRRWLSNHPLSPSWPAVFEGVANHYERLGLADQEKFKEDRDLALAKLQATTPDHLDWPRLWSSLCKLDGDAKLRQLAYARLIVAPIEMKGLGRVLAEMIKMKKSDPTLVEIGETYLRRIDPHRVSYDEVKEAMKLADQDVSAAEVDI